MAAKSDFWAKRSLRVRDDRRTKAAELTLKESIYPIIIVTLLCKSGADASFLGSICEAWANLPSFVLQ
jgi:hypothetical protein